MFLSRNSSISGYGTLQKGRRLLSLNHFQSHPASSIPNISTLNTPRQRTVDEALVVHQAQLLLDQKLYVINLITAEDYVKKVPNIYHSSIGSHLRHSFDHFSALLRAASSNEGFANYDERARDTIVESNREAAVNLIQEMKDKIDQLDLNKNIEVSFIGNEKTYEAYKIPSTVLRELSFASHHAVHHLSMVKLILQHLNYQLPENSPLGIALSTAKDIESKQNQNNKQ